VLLPTERRTPRTFALPIAATKRKNRRGTQINADEILYAQGKEFLGDKIEKDETVDEQRTACKCNF